MKDDKDRDAIHDAITAALGLLLLAMVLFTLPDEVFGDTNLPVACIGVSTDLTGKPVKDCPWSNQKFIRVTPESWVRTCRPVDPATTCTATTLQWQRFVSKEQIDPIEVCTVDKPPGSPITGTEASCAKPGGGTWSGMKIVPKYEAAVVPPLPPSSAFTVAPTSGNSPLNVTLTWNIPGMASGLPCNASGDWSGQKAAVGNEVISGLMKSSSFTLTCAAASKEIAVVIAWKAPTTNTDGTPLTNITGYSVSYGQSPSVLNGAASAPASATSVIIKDFNFKPGRWYFAMRALAGGNQSDLSNLISLDLVTPPGQVVQPFTGTVNVTLATQPNAPVGITATQIDAPTTSQQALDQPQPTQSK